MKISFRIRILLFLVLNTCLVTFVFAETIKLKSGKTREGKILERTDKYIKIDFYDVPLIYFFEDIETINGKTCLSEPGEQNNDATSPHQEESEMSEFIHHSNYINEVFVDESLANILNMPNLIFIAEQGIKKIESLQAPLSCANLKSFTIEYFKLLGEQAKELINGNKERSDSLYSQAMEYQKKVLTEIENLKNKFGIAERDRYRSEAEYYGNRKEYKKSIELLNKALNLDPHFFEGYMALAAAHQKDGNNDKAIECAFNAIKTNPSSAWAYYRLGDLYCSKGDLEKAELYTNKALELYPDYAAAYFNLGLIYCGKGEIDQSIASFKKALSLGLNKEHAGLARGNLAKIESNRYWLEQK